MRFIPNYAYIVFLCLILTFFALNFSFRKGLSIKKSVTVTATILSNHGPFAIVSAHMTTGKAPIIVKWTGSNSGDYKAITKYLWKFKGGKRNIKAPNPAHTFKKPGTYPVEFTVTDTQVLRNTKPINIIAKARVIIAPDLSYYLTTNGSSNNDGLSESKAWSIEHAFRNRSWIIPVDNYGV